MPCLLPAALLSQKTCVDRIIVRSGWAKDCWFFGNSRGSLPTDVCCMTTAGIHGASDCTSAFCVLFKTILYRQLDPDDAFTNGVRSSSNSHPLSKQTSVSSESVVAYV